MRDKIIVLHGKKEMVLINGPDMNVADMAKMLCKVVTHFGFSPAQIWHVAAAMQEDNLCADVKPCSDGCSCDKRPMIDWYEPDPRNCYIAD